MALAVYESATMPARLWPPRRPPPFPAEPPSNRFGSAICCARMGDYRSQRGIPCPDHLFGVSSHMFVERPRRITRSFIGLGKFSWNKIRTTNQTLIKLATCEFMSGFLGMANAYACACARSENSTAGILRLACLLHVTFHYAPEKKLSYDPL